MSSSSLEVFKQKLYDYLLEILGKVPGQHMSGWTTSMISNSFHIIENNTL